MLCFGRRKSRKSPLFHLSSPPVDEKFTCLASFSENERDKVANVNLGFQVHPWRRPASLRARPTSSAYGSNNNNNKLSPSSKPATIDEGSEDVHLRRVHSFESDEK